MGKMNSSFFYTKRRVKKSALVDAHNSLQNHDGGNSWPILPSGGALELGLMSCFINDLPFRFELVDFLSLFSMMTTLES